jgi:hypothetical protein
MKSQIADNQSLEQNTIILKYFFCLGYYWPYVLYRFIKY